eukprot:3588907-Prymnesium_polylepis.1
MRASERSTPRESCETVSEVSGRGPGDAKPISGVDARATGVLARPSCGSDDVETEPRIAPRPVLGPLAPPPTARMWPRLLTTSAARPHDASCA